MGRLLPFVIHSNHPEELGSGLAAPAMFADMDLSCPFVTTPSGKT
jgi:hypothetical protein